MALFSIPWPEIPACAWQRPLGDGGDAPASATPAPQGMPLGGLGAGCIGRSPRGDFNHWHLDSGEPIAQSLPACQFAIFEQPETGPAQAYALGTAAPPAGTLSRWRWYPPAQGRYAALYPRSWFHYQGVFAAEVICEQFSPVWAHCYQESSYPLAVFEWTVRNPTTQPLTLSILLSWQNVVGWFTNARAGAGAATPYQAKWGDSTGNFNQWIVDRHRVGVLFNRVRLYDELHPGEGQMAIASVSNPAVENFYLGRWNPSGDGGEVWDWFAHDGSLPDQEDETPAAPGEQIAAAMALRFTLRPGRTRKLPFYLAWDFPILECAPGVTYFRRHSDFFARTGNNAWTMVRTALKHSDVWKEKIEQWQAPILQRPDWPDWFKRSLCNELYLLTDGGTLWTAATETAPVGQFALLTSREQRRYEDLGARLYGSFALLLLWPRLEKAVLEAFARAVERPEAGYPQDLGSPRGHPWEQGSRVEPAEASLDLGSLFVIQVYRTFLLTDAQDTDFLWECWSAIATSLPPAAPPTTSRWAATTAALAIATRLQQQPPRDPALEPADYPASLEAAIAQYQAWLTGAATVARTVTPAATDRYACVLDLTAAVAEELPPVSPGWLGLSDQFRHAAQWARNHQLEAAWAAAALVQQLEALGCQFCSPAAIAPDGRYDQRAALAALALWALYGALTDANPSPTTSEAMA